MGTRKYGFVTRHAGEWYELKDKKQLMVCCDCGLGHRYEYRIRNGKLYQRGFRAKGLTSAARRTKKHRFRKVG